MRAASSASRRRRWGIGAASTFIITWLPSCCSLRELFLAMSRCEVFERVSPGRVGWRSLAVVALGREMVTRLMVWIFARGALCTEDSTLGLSSVRPKGAL